MRTSPHVQPLPFQTLHKNNEFKIWWRKIAFGLLGFAVLCVVIFVEAELLHLAYPDPKKDTLDIGGLLGNIIAGFIGAGIVAVMAYFQKVGHAKIHYAKELQHYINTAQDRYQVSRDEAGDLLEFDNAFLMTIDNFFRYIGTSQEAEMLSKIQRFGTIILPQSKGYLRVTLYWETGKGFFLTEESAKMLTDFA